MSSVIHKCVCACACVSVLDADAEMESWVMGLTKKKYLLFVCLVWMCICVCVHSVCGYRVYKQIPPAWYPVYSCDLVLSYVVQDAIT